VTTRTEGRSRARRSGVGPPPECETTSSIASPCARRESTAARTVSSFRYARTTTARSGTLAAQGCGTLGTMARLRRPQLAVPSGGFRAPPRQVRLLALVAVRDEIEHLPRFVANVAPHVDGIIALDDRSSDGSGAVLAGCEEVLEVIAPDEERRDWDEVGNHRRLVAAGVRHAADWLLALDADERVEREFRARAERVLRRAGRLGAFAVRLRELWDAPDRYRADGLWSRKAPARLFRARSDHVFDEAALHGTKAPLQARRFGRYILADLYVYHLGMLRAEDRAARRQRYELADADARFQAGLGYAYLTDERGLELRPLPAGRGFVE
jgi:hypothetical protein